MAIVAIMSVGVYNAYLLLIRQTKAGEVKQTVALEGKKIIEDIKGNTDGKSFDVTKSTLDLGDISLEKKGPSGEEYFEKEIHLNKDFETTTDTNYLYTQTIKIQKAKSVKSDKTECNIDLDNKIVSASGTAENTNRISYNLKLIKASNIGSKVYIQDDNHGPLEVSKNHEGKVVLNVYIQTENGVSGSTKNVSVKDFDGTLPLTEVKKLPLSNGKADQLYLSINFDEYKKQESGTLNTEINVFNYDQETATNITNINIEKPRELDVDVKARKGEVNIYSNRTKSTDVVKFGTLYDIQVNIKDKDGQDLFSGFSNQNINIK